MPYINGWGKIAWFARDVVEDLDIMEGVILLEL